MYLKNFFSFICICLLLLALSCKTKDTTVKSANKDTIVTTESKAPTLEKTFPLPNGHIVDYDRILSEDEKSSLEKVLRAFEEETTINIGVVTFDSTMTTEDGVEFLTRKLANYWKTGNTRNGYGILVGFSKRHRKLRVENSNNIQKILSDAETKRIVDEDFIPAFKQGSYYEGIKKGLLALMKKLREKYTA